MTIPNGLLQPTTRLEDDPADNPKPTTSAEQGSANDDARPVKSRRSRKATKPTLDEKMEGRKIYLSDDLYDRLRLWSFQRKTTVSNLVQTILEREVPRFELKRVD